MKIEKDGYRKIADAYYEKQKFFRAKVFKFMIENDEKLF